MLSTSVTASATTNETHANGKSPLLLFVLLSHSFFFFFSYFTVIRYASAVDSADSVVDTSCTVPRLAVLFEPPLLARDSTHPLVVPATNETVQQTVRRVRVGRCALVPTCTPYTSTRIVAATANDGDVRRRSNDGSEATNHPIRSPANLGPGKLRFGNTMFSHWLFLLSFADLERRSVPKRSNYRSHIRIRKP